MLLKRKTLLELSIVGGVVLLNHHCTRKGGEDLYIVAQDFKGEISSSTTLKPSTDY
jgi:hypothetical protein